MKTIVYDNMSEFNPKSMDDIKVEILLVGINNIDPLNINVNMNDFDNKCIVATYPGEVIDECLKIKKDEIYKECPFDYLYCVWKVILEDICYMFPISDRRYFRAKGNVFNFKA